MQEINPSLFRTVFKQNYGLPFHNLLNLWAVEDKAVIGVDLQMTFVYELTLPDLIIKSESEINDYYQAVKNILHSLPDNITLQIVLKLTEGDKDLIEAYKSTTHPETELDKYVVDSKVNNFSKVFLQKKRIYLFLTTYPEQDQLNKVKSPMGAIFYKNYTNITQTIHDTRINKLNDLSQILISSLYGAGINARQLNSQEIISYGYEYLNPSRTDFLNSKNIDSDKTLRSQICLNAVEHNFDSVYTDGYYFRAVNLHTRPESVNFTMLHKLIATITSPVDLVFIVKTANQEDITKKVFVSGSVARNINNISGFRKNHEADALQADADNLIEETKTTFQKLYYYSFAAIVRDRTLETLTSRTNAIVESFRSFGESESIIDDMNHLPIMLTALPGHSHLNNRKHIFHTEAIAQMLPLFSEWEGCKSPKMLFQTNDDCLLPIDLFDPSLSAKHSIVCGRTGSGKSFATNFLLANFKIENPNNHIIIIDVGGSYRKLCSMFGGQYFDIELSEEFAFNPFPSSTTAITNSSEPAFEVDSDVLSFLTNIVMKLLKLTNISGREQKILENALTNTYRYSKQDPPLIGSLHKQLMNYKGDMEDVKTAIEYGKNLEIWTAGRYGKLLNRHTTLTTDAPLVVFDLQKLSEQPELQSIIFFLITNVIEKKLKDLSLQKKIVIDEAWTLFNDEIGARLIENLYRTARKFNAAIMSISQNPEDFVNSKAASAILSCTYVKYILPLKSGFEVLKHFGFGEAEIEQVRELKSLRGKYSEVYLKFGDHNRILKIQPSRADYWICTTDPEDFNKESAFRASHSDYTEAQILKGLAESK